jgi:WD40 repeat protein
MIDRTSSVKRHTMLSIKTTRRARCSNCINFSTYTCITCFKRLCDSCAKKGIVEKEHRNHKIISITVMVGRHPIAKRHGTLDEQLAQSAFVPGGKITKVVVEHSMDIPGMTSYIPKGYWRDEIFPLLLDSDHIAVFSDSLVHIWDMRTGKWGHTLGFDETGTKLQQGMQSDISWMRTVGAAHIYIQTKQGNDYKSWGYLYNWRTGTVASQIDMSISICSIFFGHYVYDTKSGSVYDMSLKEMNCVAKKLRLGNDSFILPGHLGIKVTENNVYNTGYVFQVWDLNTNTLVMSINLPMGGYYRPIMNNITAIDDSHVIFNNEYTVNVIDRSVTKSKYKLSQQAGVGAIAFINNNTVQFMNECENVYAEVSGNIHWMQLSPNKKWMITAGDKCQLWRIYYNGEGEQMINKLKTRIQDASFSDVTLYVC